MIKAIKTFLACHVGTVNILFHIVGIGLVVLGLYAISLIVYLGGWGLQALGHLVERKVFGNKKANPMNCKTEVIFVGLFIFIPGLIYILLK